jgi:hypothetical protein
LEPVESQNSPEFYPQDLWEIALWRPIVDNEFSSQHFEEILKDVGFKLIERGEMEFEYDIFSKMRFSQKVRSLRLC